MKKWTGTLEVLAAGSLFGFLGIFGKLAYERGISVGELLTFRFLLAGLTLAAMLAVLRRDWLFIGRRQTLTSVLLGVFGYAVFSTLYFESIKGMTVGLAALILFSFPLFVNLGSILFLKEKPGAAQVLSLALSSFGLVLLVWGDWEIQQARSLACGIGAAVTYAGYVLVSGQVQKDVRPLSSSLFVILGAGATLALFHRPSFPGLLEWDAERLAVVAGIAFFCTIAPLTLFLAGLQKMPSSRASVLVMIEPVVASLAGAVIFSERMSVLQMTGAGLILAALAIPAHRSGPSESLS